MLFGALPELQAVLYVRKEGFYKHEVHVLRSIILFLEEKKESQRPQKYKIFLSVILDSITHKKSLQIVLFFRLHWCFKILHTWTGDEPSQRTLSGSWCLEYRDKQNTSAGDTSERWQSLGLTVSAVVPEYLPSCEQEQDFLVLALEPVPAPPWG